MTHWHGSYLTFDYLRASKPGNFNEYKGSWVETLNEAGFAVCGIDNQGQGRSEGVRSYIEKFEDYVSDVVQLIHYTRAGSVPGFPPAAASGTAEVEIPYFLMGGSLGGCLSTMVALHTPELVKGLVLLAPMLSLEKVSRQGINPYLRPLAALLSKLAPRLAIAKTSKNYLYPDLQLCYDLDPNCWHADTRVRNAVEYLRVTSWLVQRGMENVTHPFLVYHGLKDDMCDPDGSRELYNSAKSKDKTLRLLGDRWHMLVKEPGNEQLLQDIVTWLNTHLQPKQE